MPNPVRTLLARDRVLALSALAMAVGLVLAAIAAPFDARVVTGINPWIKPMKFLLSVGIFLATVAWLMPEVRAAARMRRLLSAVIASTMLFEIVCIVGQAARGTTSHFNQATGFDGAIFALMGLAITVNTLAVAALWWWMRRDDPPDRAAYLLGVRLGLALFVLGSLQGFVIVANQGHSLPGPDGGPGLPFLNWSVDRGDLRVAHFISLHALQALPLLGYLLDRSGGVGVVRRRGMVSAVAVLWFGLTGAALALALRGVPLLPR